MIARALFTASLLSLSLCSQAAVILSIQQVDGDVLITGSGSVTTLNGLSNQQAATAPGTMLFPDFGLIASQNFSGDLFHVAAAPADFGSGMPVFPTVVSSSGAAFAITGTDTLANPGTITLPSDYELGSPITFTLRVTGSSLAQLGIRTGSYRWSWGTPDNGDYVVLYAGVPPTLPAAGAPVAATPVAVPVAGVIPLAMTSLGLLGAAGVLRRKKKTLKKA